jgi:hypothetical protein
MRWARHVVRIVEKRNAYRLLVGKPEGEKDYYDDQDVGSWAVIVNCCTEELVGEARGQFRKTEEGERPPLEAVSRRSVKKAKT